MERKVTFGWPFGDDGLICIGVFALIFFLASCARRVSNRCPRCQEVNRPAAVYCAQCGQRLPGK